MVFFISDKHFLKSLSNKKAVYWTNLRIYFQVMLLDYRDAFQFHGNSGFELEVYSLKICYFRQYLKERDIPIWFVRYKLILFHLASLILSFIRLCDSILVYDRLSTFFLRFFWIFRFPFLVFNFLLLKHRFMNFNCLFILSLEDF